MPKKIYDIKPPKTRKKKETSIKKTETPVEIKVIKRTRVQHQNEEKPFWIPVAIAGSIFLLIVCIYMFFKLPRVEIAIWPKVDVLSYQQTIKADKTISSIDLKKQVIPAQYFETSKVSSQDFPATGSASNEGKASGLITVYNKCDPATPVTLAKGAHFLSDSGKSFSYLQKIVIPAATKKLGKTIPGSVQITVTADESGSEYNIAPAAFSIPKLNGTIYYSCIYATSDEEMIGGYTGKVKKVTDDDIYGAKEVLTKQASEDAMSLLKDKISSEYITLNNAVTTTTVNATTKVKSGAIVDNFNYQVEIKASALAFKKSDIEQIAKDYILSQVPEGKTLLEKDFKLDYSTGTIDMSAGNMIVNLDFSSGVYENIDKNSMTLSFMGQNDEQIRRTIENSYGDQVSEVQVKFWPFWVKSAPNNQKSIRVELKF